MTDITNNNLNTNPRDIENYPSRFSPSNKTMHKIGALLFIGAVLAGSLILVGALIISSPILGMGLMAAGTIIGSLIIGLTTWKSIKLFKPKEKASKTIAYSLEAKEAFDYAETQINLYNNEETTPYDWKLIKAPKNEKISMLVNIKALKWKQIKPFIQNKDRFGPESKEWVAFNQNMKEYIQLGFVITTLSLEELTLYSRDQDTIGNLLIDPNNYFSQAFFSAPLAYQIYRLTPFKNDSEREASFYTKGTTENYCRLLFNSLNVTIRDLIPLNLLKQKNESFHNYIMQDLGRSYLWDQATFLNQGGRVPDKFV